MLRWRLARQLQLNKGMKQVTRNVGRAFSIAQGYFINVCYGKMRYAFEIWRTSIYSHGFACLYRLGSKALKRALDSWRVNTAVFDVQRKQSLLATKIMTLIQTFAGLIMASQNEAWKRLLNLTHENRSEAICENLRRLYLTRISTGIRRIEIGVRVMAISQSTSIVLNLAHLVDKFSSHNLAIAFDLWSCRKYVQSLHRLVIALQTPLRSAFKHWSTPSNTKSLNATLKIKGRTLQCLFKIRRRPLTLHKAFRWWARGWVVLNRIMHELAYKTSISYQNAIWRWKRVLSWDKVRVIEVPRAKTCNILMNTIDGRIKANLIYAFSALSQPKTGSNVQIISILDDHKQTYLASRFYQWKAATQFPFYYQKTEQISRAVAILSQGLRSAFSTIVAHDSSRAQLKIKLMLEVMRKILGSYLNIWRTQTMTKQFSTMKFSQLVSIMDKYAQMRQYSNFLLWKNIVQTENLDNLSQLVAHSNKITSISQGSHLDQFLSILYRPDLRYAFCAILGPERKVVLHKAFKNMNNTSKSAIVHAFKDWRSLTISHQKDDVIATLPKLHSGLHSLIPLYQNQLRYGFAALKRNINAKKAQSTAILQFQMRIRKILAISLATWKFYADLHSSTHQLKFNANVALQLNDLKIHQSSLMSSRLRFGFKILQKNAQKYQKVKSCLSVLKRRLMQKI